ncbi:tRNA (guanine-N(7)-)-methyltransferase non-catalytic subunit WDR4-like [Xenia sp. Carnegie-2017]|uniref:tRNA (guanine-N(7)-)-methyltransferase non-catalytic subunit WDR4-like n=1 Tax=Xenia sp. Carnegie-2017 TaxID=2897299 RepID=UPI001F0386EA|nr:tRNA (guanine-N(7)-)-methyltransferase non-catalytic subunit WDR4-like [Xenia sp. Carnegie-2017]
MVVIKCSDNGHLAFINETSLRVYDLRKLSLVHKFSFASQESNGEISKVENDFEKEQKTTFTYGCQFSNSGKFLAAFSDSKDLVVLKTDDWQSVGKRKLPKRPTAVLFTNKEDSVVISDKSGDVYSYHLSEENGLSNEALLLGHVSIILDMVITRDDCYIITADRDEKIRVSKFPNSYNIKTFCLGHTEFVWKIILLSNLSNEILVSVSGDGTIRFWDYKVGKTLYINDFETSTTNKEKSVISSLACSQRNRIVFVGVEGSSVLHAFKVDDSSTIEHLLSSKDLVLDGEICGMDVDKDNHLWVIQSSKNQPVVIFEICEENGTYKFKKQCSWCSFLTSEDIKFINDGIKIVLVQ